MHISCKDFWLQPSVLITTLHGCVKIQKYVGEMAGRQTCNMWYGVPLVMMRHVFIASGVAVTKCGSLWQTASKHWKKMKLEVTNNSICSVIHCKVALFLKDGLCCLYFPSVGCSASLTSFVYSFFSNSFCFHSYCSFVFSWPSYSTAFQIVIQHRISHIPWRIQLTLRQTHTYTHTWSTG